MSEENKTEVINPYTGSSKLTDSDVREMLSKVKDGMYSGRDPRLSEHKEQIFSLERAVTHAIYFSV